MTWSDTSALAIYIARAYSELELYSSIMSRDIKAYLTQKKADSPTPEIAQDWVTLEQHYNKR